jgi:hypothetical protein
VGVQVLHIDRQQRRGTAPQVMERQRAMMTGVIAEQHLAGAAPLSHLYQWPVEAAATPCNPTKSQKSKPRGFCLVDHGLPGGDKSSHDYS